MSAELREEKIGVMNAVMDAVSGVELTHTYESSHETVSMRDETAVQLLNAVSSVLHDMSVGSVDECGVGGGKRPVMTRTTMRVRAAACMGIVNDILKYIDGKSVTDIHCEWKMIDGLGLFSTMCGTSYPTMSRFCPHCGLRIKNINIRKGRVSDGFNMG